MTLRARLILSFTALLVVAIAVVGVVATRSVRSVLTHQIDKELIEVSSRPVPSGVGPEAGDELLNRSVAIVVQAEDGTTLFSSPSGFFDNPDPLPDVSSVPSDFHGFDQIGAVDGSIDYRILVLHDPARGTIGYFASPLTAVDAAADSILRILVIAGSIVLALGAGATWYTVRRGLRPVDRMVTTATAIAAGDLSQRVEEAGPSTELGRLSAAFNDMLANIEDAMTAEREAQDRLRQFVSDASHELRTPISAIGGYAELYRRGGLVEPGELDRALGRIEKESARMRRLVDDLLLLAKLDEHQDIDLTRVDLVATVRDAVEDHRAIDPERPVAVDAPRSAWVLGDELRLGQVVGNLLANVRIHTPPGTAVRVRVARDERRVVLSVTDDGPGIDEDALDKVFDRFYRLDASRSRRSGGTGLGLAIVAAIVAAHGGTITAANGPSGGAEITVTLPAAADDVQPHESWTASPATLDPVSG